MREETTTSGYDQPRTGPIPALDDEPERRQARPEHTTPDQVPDQADGSYGTPPPDPEPAPGDRRESDLDPAAPGPDGPRDVDAGNRVDGAPATVPTFGEPRAEPGVETREETRDADPMVAPAGTAGPADSVVAPAAEGAAPRPDASADTATGTGAHTGAHKGVDTDDSGAALFGGDDVERFRGRWRELQADFVDDPMQAVEGADSLVDEVMRALADTVAEHKRELDAQWRGGETGETEQLRMALRRYRSFFDQLLRT